MVEAQFRRLNVLVSNEAFNILARFQKHKDIRNKDTALDNFIKAYPDEKDWK